MSPDASRSHAASVSNCGRISQRGARGERAAEHVDDAVHVMQRQHEQRAVVARPLPGRQQRRHLRGVVAVRDHGALRPSRRAAGVEDQRGRARGQVCACATGAVAVLADLTPVAVARQQVRGADEAGARRRGDRLERVGLPAAADDDRGARVADHVLELRRRMRDRERDGDAAGEPDAARDHDIREARRDEERDALHDARSPSARQLRRDARRGLRQVVVREHAVSGDDGEAVGSDSAILRRAPGVYSISRYQVCRRWSRSRLQPT